MISSDLSNGGMSCSTPACESSRNIGFLGALGIEKMLCGCSMLERVLEGGALER
jgi:hypothetical protein